MTPCRPYADRIRASLTRHDPGARSTTSPNTSKLGTIFSRHTTQPRPALRVRLPARRLGSCLEDLQPDPFAELRIG